MISLGFLRGTPQVTPQQLDILKQLCDIVNGVQLSTTPDQFDQAHLASGKGDGQDSGEMQQASRLTSQLLNFFVKQHFQGDPLKNLGDPPLINGDSIQKILSDSRTDEDSASDRYRSRYALWQFFRGNCVKLSLGLNFFKTINIGKQTLTKVLSDLESTNTVAQSTMKTVVEIASKTPTGASLGAPVIVEQTVTNGAAVLAVVLLGNQVKSSLSSYVANTFPNRPGKPAPRPKPVATHPPRPAPTRPAKPPRIPQNSYEFQQSQTVTCPDGRKVPLYSQNGQYIIDPCNQLTGNVAIPATPTQTPSSIPVYQGPSSIGPPVTIINRPSGNPQPTDQPIYIPPGTPIAQPQSPNYNPPSTGQISPWCFSTINRPGFNLALPARFRRDGTGNVEYQQPNNPAWYPTEIPASSMSCLPSNPNDLQQIYQTQNSDGSTNWTVISTPASGGSWSQDMQAPVEIAGGSGIHGLAEPINEVNWLAYLIAGGFVYWMLTRKR